MSRDLALSLALFALVLHGMGVGSFGNRGDRAGALELPWCRPVLPMGSDQGSKRPMPFDQNSGICVHGTLCPARRAAFNPWAPPLV